MKESKRDAERGQSGCAIVVMSVPVWDGLSERITEYVIGTDSGGD